MAAYDFPDTAGKPTDGSFQYTAPDGTLYEWNGYAWTVPPGEGGGGSGGGDFEVPTQALPPAGAVDGDMFWCTDDGRLYIYYEDADTKQWVDASPDNTSEAVDSYWAKSGSTLSPIDAADSVDIGSGNITLNANGVGVFENVVQSGKNPAGAAGQGTRLTPTGVILATRDDADEQVFAGYTTGNSLATLSLNADGSSKFAGDMAIGITGSFTPSTPAISLNADGKAKYASLIQIGPNRGSSSDDNDGTLLGSDGRIVLFRSSTSSSNSYLRCHTSTGSGYEDLLAIRKDGSLWVGGQQTLSTPLPNITLNADGSVTFAGGKTSINSAGQIQSNDNPIGGAGRGVFITNGLITAGRRDHADAIFQGYVAGTADPTVKIMAGGSASFAGAITADNVTFNLEADDDTKYTSTTDADGNQTLVYNGAVLDVKERIQNVLARMDAIEANEVTDDATDSALLTLVASLSSRLDERDATIAALTTRISTLEIQSNGGNS